jgi:predicted DNA-binding protein
MNIQYIRLDDTVCEILNRLALEQRRTVSEVVNEILRGHLHKVNASERAEEATSGQKAANRSEVVVQSL